MKVIGITLLSEERLTKRVQMGLDNLRMCFFMWIIDINADILIGRHLDRINLMKRKCFGIILVIFGTLWHLIKSNAVSALNPPEKKVS